MKAARLSNQSQWTECSFVAKSPTTAEELHTQFTSWADGVKTTKAEELNRQFTSPTAGKNHNLNEFVA